MISARCRRCGLDRTGYGAGSMERHDGRPNLLRLLLGQGMVVQEAQQVEVIETHLDDWNPEFWPYVSERLMTAGALDVCLIPIQMKKGRPGFLLRVIAEPATRETVTTVVFSETSAIGLRLRREERLTLPREIVTVSHPLGRSARKKNQHPERHGHHPRVRGLPHASRGASPPAAGSVCRRPPPLAGTVFLNHHGPSVDVHCHRRL